MKLQTPPPHDVGNVPLDAVRRDPAAFAVEQSGKYLHWDELRRRPKRPALTHDEWWRVVKLARWQLARKLPLTDPGGAAFTFAMTDTIQRLVHSVDRDASGRIELPEEVTSPGTRDRYVVNSLIEESFRSSQLEGASTTRHVAKEMIRTGRAPRTDSEQMILNNFYAMEWVREQKDTALSVERLLELHAIVTRDTLDASEGAGRFRRPDETISVVDPHDGEVVHEPPPAKLLPARMEQLCAFANGTTADEPFIHPVLRAILVHFWLAYDHPFVDGNGRTARALFYWLMLRQGYWLTEFISISRVIKQARAQYDRAFLYTETDANDTTYFLVNQLQVLRKAIDDLFVYLKRKAQEVRDVERSLRGRDDLNHRQLAALSYMLRNADARVTVEGHQTSHRVVYQTARTDLLDLTKRGYVEMTKVGKKMYFHPAADLERRLRGAR
jgi:Fic family protein